MRRYIAFLRGLNVGGHRVKMDRLRGLFEDLGLTDVSTFIASGNVVFSDESGDVETLTDRIERHLARELGYDVATFLRSPGQLDDIVASYDPADGDESRSTTSVYVIFLREPAGEALRSVLGNLGAPADEFRFSGAEIIWRFDGKITESPRAKGAERALRREPNTMRNINTLRRISAKLGTD